MNERTSLLQSRLKEFSEDQKYAILKSLDEHTLRLEIKELICAMDPDSYVEVYHGPNEYGKDLVVIRQDKFGEKPTAVVVTLGDIHTRSSGLIDKIKSQVEQCFEHPAFLKPIKGPTEIAHVWIMIAGTLSQGANLRITKETKRPNITVFDLKWMAKQFSEYYPHVYFEGRASKYLEDKIQDLERSHFLSGRDYFADKNLSQFYVEPLVAKIDTILELSEDQMTFTLLTDSKHLDELRKDLLFPNKFIVVGDPGVGKSTALSKMAIDIYSESLSQATVEKTKQLLAIPILVKAKDIVGLGNLTEFLDQYGPSEEIRDRFVIRVIMVDALDEVPGPSRKQVIDKSTDYANQLHSALLVSSRNIDITREVTLTLERMELLPFEFNQALNLFKKLVSNERMLQSLKDGLMRVQGQLPLTPLSLVFMVELVESNKEVPASIVELYDRFTDIALGSEDRIKKGIDTLFDYQIKRKFLQEFAYIILFKKGRDRVDKTEFDGFLNEYAKRFGWSEVQLRDFSLEIERVGLLSMRDKVFFSHASFLDYFAACYLDDVREEIPNLTDFVTELYFDDIWTDVAFFYSGIRRKITKKLINSILNYTGHEDNLRTNVNKMGVGRLLQAAWHSDLDEKEFGLEGALKLRTKVREQAKDFMERHPGKHPGVYADWYTLAVAKIAFGSRFLWEASKRVITKLINEDNQESMTNAIHLAWAARDKLPKDQLDVIDEMLLEGTIKAPQIEYQDRMQYATNLLLLNMMCDSNSEACKAINKKLRRVFKVDTKLSTLLLPPVKTGFRSTEARRRAIQKKLAKSKKNAK
jgi:hypothetical protein